MEMTMRWYGTGYDTVTLKQIKQTRYVTGVITTLYDTQPGEVWSREKIRALKQEVEAAGLHLAGIESLGRVLFIPTYVYSFIILKIKL